MAYMGLFLKNCMDSGLGLMCDLCAFVFQKLINFITGYVCTLLTLCAWNILWILASANSLVVEMICFTPLPLIIHQRDCSGFWNLIMAYPCVISVQFFLKICSLLDLRLYLTFVMHVHLWLIWCFIANWSSRMLQKYTEHKIHETFRDP